MFLYNFSNQKIFFARFRYLKFLFIGIASFSLSQNICSSAHATIAHRIYSAHSVYSSMHSYNATALPVHINSIAEPAPTTSKNNSASENNTSTSKSFMSHHPILHAIANFFRNPIHPKSTYVITHSDSKTTPISASASTTDIFHAISNTLSNIIQQNPLTKLVTHWWNAITNIGTVPTLSPSPTTLANAAGKVPVILVHGTTGNADDLLTVYQSLDQAGIPAYADTFGTGGFSIPGLLNPTEGEVAPLETSEKQLANFIAHVQKETGAKQVDLIGHSQGGLLIKDYLAHDNENNVRAVVDLAADNHGSTLDGYSDFLNGLIPPVKKIILTITALAEGESFPEQLPDSHFVTALNKYPDTKAGIHYLVLGTRDDLVSTPYNATYLKPVPGAFVTNEEVHSLPGVIGFISHTDMTNNPAIVRAITKYIQTYGEPQATTVPALQASMSSVPPTVSLLN